MKSTEITLGYMEAPLTEQLANFVSEKDAEMYERDNRAINRLAVRGLVSEGQMNGLRKKLLKRIRVSARQFPNDSAVATAPKDSDS